MKKYKFTDNLGLKIMALVFAALLWLVVVNIDDPIESATFRNIPVTLQNTQVVTNGGDTYTILDDTQTVSVVVTAKRSILSKISTDNIAATADFAEMQMESLVPIKASLTGYDKYTAEATPSNLKVKIEKYTTKVFPLTVSASGAPRDGHVVGEFAPNPNKIQVNGPESLVNSIDKAVAKVDVSGISKSGVLPAELIFYGSSGNLIETTQLTNNLGKEGVTVNVTVLNTKNLTLKFSVSGMPETGYVFSGLTSEPEKIQVCGTADALSSISVLEIPATELDITGMNKKMEKTVDILPYLPDGIELVDETANNVIVTVSIEEEGTRTIELPAESIRVDNLNDNLLISYDKDTKIELQFRGPKQDLDALDLKDAVYIDMKSRVKPGKYDVPVNVDLPDDVKAEVSLSKRPSVKVTVTEKEDNTGSSDSTDLTESTEPKDKE
ncbi:hypothetical protein HGO97_002840 [Faecalicatena sp. AGMB00832]|uniref:YbbR domain-containing protein n=1 Tax=Faecalicatena faecalis TaxID=2726362 RepID=A0ABS6CZJ4_9FIRM|nr:MULTISPECIES: CdaR family protein [Faecalicatena]MBU3874749.1 hypothetical protein [Faecalicatena faecalis]MCI6465869.1 CdaR family protein [Faecalicatena sp.]MDY5618715.1 CdaR family protein [Lachnospiraceae bacterium]